MDLFIIKLCIGLICYIFTYLDIKFKFFYQLTLLRIKINIYLHFFYCLGCYNVFLVLKLVKKNLIFFFHARAWLVLLQSSVSDPIFFIFHDWYSFVCHSGLISCQRTLLFPPKFLLFPPQTLFVISHFQKDPWRKCISIT